MPDEHEQGRTKHVAVLFADISGSSLMYVQRGDTVGYSLTSACLSLMDKQVQLAGGRVVKTIGDAVLAVFDTTQGAVNAGVGIQQALDQPSSLLRAEGIHVRMGISSGRVMQAGDDVFGDVVNVTARLASHASPDEILLSDRAYEELPPAMRDTVRLLDRAVLRGRPSWVQIYEYLWKSEADRTVSAASRVRPLNSALHLTYGSRTFVVDVDAPKLRIGRAGDNDVTIEQDVVSRYHAEITLRGSKFFLADASTNGTYLHPDGGEAVRVLREDISLSGSGKIFAGSENAPPIGYQVVAKR